MLLLTSFFDTGLADTELITQDMSGGLSSGGSSILYMEPQTPGTFDHIGATLQTSGGISERNMQAAWNDDSFKVIGGGSIMGNGANFNAGIQMQQMMQVMQMQQMQQQLLQMQLNEQVEESESMSNKYEDTSMDEAEIKTHDSQSIGASYDIEEALQEAMNSEGDLSMERLEDVWEQFQLQNPSASQGVDETWEDMKSLDRTEGGYNFATHNSYLVAHQDKLFEQGVRLFQEGRVSEAILAFEANLQVHADHDESWRILGLCHAENDMDREAIICLKRAVECDPYNLEALLALGTSYVNELDSAEALRVLKAWVMHHPSFCGLNPPKDEYSDGTLMDEVMQLILSAHARSPQDVDVKVLLGVLYNVSQNFDQAAQLFREAILMRPTEYSLYNKLGATLANSNGSADAIPLYTKALEMRPSYARGWLNLGISHANLNQYEEAARAYVNALDLNPQGKHMWGYLRVVFTCMNELDAVEMCGKEDLQSIARFLDVQLRSLR
eukprot:GSChrysophyteH1.ASY1.ANO1.2364.1 assembled CDS